MPVRRDFVSDGEKCDWQWKRGGTRMRWMAEGKESPRFPGFTVYQQG